jgi:GAF domain-containing protein
MNHEALFRFLKNKYSGTTEDATNDIKRLDMFLEDTIEILRAFFNTEAISLFVVDNKSEEIYALVSAGAGTEDLNKITIKFGIGIVGHTARDRAPIISNHPESDVRFNRGFDRKTNFKTKNILSYPVIIDGNLIAIIELINKSEGNFSEDDIRLLDSFVKEFRGLLFKAINNNSFLRN